MDWGKLIDWIKLSPKYLLPLILVSGILIFAPVSLLAILGLDNFIVIARPWIGLIFLLASALFIVDILFNIYGWAKKKLADHKIRKIRFERLHKLTPAEKWIFLGYIIGNTRTQDLDYSNGVVGGLEAERFIFKATQFGDTDSWAYNIQPWVWDLFHKNLEEYFTKGEMDKYRKVNRMDI